MRSDLQIEFPDGPDGRARLYLLHRPPHGMPLRGAIVQVHAWAEEMNKSRAMVACTARALAEQGWMVLQPDLLGCGDSDGELADATLAAWVADVTGAVRWLRARCPDGPLWLWGHRFGALLTAQAAAALGEPLNLLWWHPVLQGRQHMQQFLRLKAAAQLADGGGKATLDAVRDALAAGQTVDVAGYPLPPALHDAVAAASATAVAPAGALPGQAPARLVWLELASTADAALSPAAERAAQAWRAAGWAVQPEVVQGPAFWQTTEIEQAPRLVEATVAALCGAGTKPVSDTGHGAGPGPGITTDAASGAPASAPRVTPAPPSSPRWPVRGLRFACASEQLAGVLHPADGSTGVLVVVGGPQYRVGSHRQFVRLARALQQTGRPVMRFDLRGMGDSTGATPQPFDDCAADLGAAVDAFVAAQPQLRRLVLWGLCDGASAALLYLHERADTRVAGLCLLNPWVRSTASLARTQVRHYYLQRALSPGFWRKLLRGEVARSALSEFLAKLGAARQTGPAAAAAPDRARPYQDRMLAGWRGFQGRSLLVLSGDDYTAREFLEYTGLDAGWRARLAAADVERLDLPEANHTFSEPADEQRLNAATLRWLDGLDRLDGPTDGAPRAAVAPPARAGHPA